MLNGSRIIQMGRLERPDSHPPEETKIRAKSPWYQW